jgi:DNA polymerase elongation subunit (family B)
LEHAPLRFYTNVSRSRDKILLRGYEKGRQIKEEVNYRPRLYVPTPSGTESEFSTIHGSPVSPFEFPDLQEAQEFVRRYEDVSNFAFYGLTSFIYPYIYDSYPGKIQYDVDQIKKATIDIETESKNGFPDIERADQAILTITMITRTEIIGLGLKPFKTTDKKVKYYQFTDEKALLESFLNIWEAQSFDVITGWNIELFDIPYLVNRIRRVLGVEEANRISPWRRLQEKKIPFKGKEYISFQPVGLNVLDYLPIFKKFTAQVYGQLESYSLDYVSNFILKKQKVNWKEKYESLHDMYEKDFQLFMEYNIHDCVLVDEIDEHERLLELVYAISYDAKVNYADALTSVRLWDVIIHNFLMDRKKVVPQFVPSKIQESIPGGFVKEPKIGLSRWVVSFDLTSLYPHLIMGYNISPDTIIGRKTSFPTVDELLATDIKFTDHSTAANGCEFTKDRPGFLPELMRLQFDLRNQYKKKMIELKREKEQTGNKELEKEIAALHNAQMAKKIQLNSAYGSLANLYFRWFSNDLASAVTLSGQLAIRWVERDLNRLLNETLGTENLDYVLAVDTDSVYLDLEPLVNFSIKGKKTDNQIADFLDKVCRILIEPHINKSYELLAIKMNAFEQAMKMKREAISSKAIWVAKKRYIANVIDNEGVRYAEPELKMMGIEAVRSSTPSAARDAIKEALRIIMNKDEGELQRYIATKKREFMSLPVEEIAFPRGINGMDKYKDARSIFKSGTPIHVRGALMYNKLLRDHKATDKYGDISDKDKIKFCYLAMPNPTFQNVFAFPDNIPKPLEFINRYIDRTMQFEKGFLDPLRTILDAIGWFPEKKHTLEEWL